MASRRNGIQHIVKADLFCIPLFQCLAFGALLLGSMTIESKLNAAPSTIDLESQIWTANLSNPEGIEKQAVRLLQENPGAYEHYLLAELNLRMFKNNPSQLRYLKNASEMSQQAIELAPNKEFGYLVAAQVLDLMGYKDEASEMLSHRPTFNQTWRSSFVRGVLAFSQADDQTGLNEFSESLKDPGASMEMIGVFVAGGLEASYSGSELVDQLVTWRKQLDTPAIQMSLGRALENTGKDAQAHHIYGELIKSKPSFEIKLTDAVVLYSKLKRQKEAEILLNDIVANAREKELSVAAKAHLATISLQKGDLKKSAKLFQDAIEDTKERIKWIAFSHRVYTENQRLQEFSLLLEELRLQLPGTGYLYALQGEVLSESLAQHSLAIEAFSSAIILDPKRSEFYNGMGLAYYRLKRHKEALITFTQALVIDPKDATARYNEACVLALLGRGEEAMGSLKQAILLDRRLHTVALNDKDFEGIRMNTQFQSLIQKLEVTTVP